ncbi:hypothetical protein F4778DRAFT_174719 [Xylariomycetidae sp. FL2044]|nr:hypothetical protein F4778DRAFT_174719 [Xylariomycetidae sp. FL2044]
MVGNLNEALSPEEDSSSLKDAKARRKLQNRLDVRADPGTLDCEDFENDMTGGFRYGDDYLEQTDLVPRGNPWRIDGFEVSSGFARKWACLLEGCHKLIESTNRYREKRGDEPLVIEV